MICKFFETPKGKDGKKQSRNGIASINYLLNERTQNGTARVLKGDENTTRAILESLDYNDKACVGVLSFAESSQELSDEQKIEIMQEFERALMTDEMAGRFNILWVEHSDKGRLELNFVIPKIDLESKKHITPYFHKADLSRIDNFGDYINAKFDLKDPKDPNRTQTIKPPNHHIKNFKDHKALDNFLKNQVEQGFFKSHNELITYLENDLKDYLEITRKGKEYISIKLNGEKSATRYKGEIYAEHSDTYDTAREIRENQTTARERAQAIRQNHSGAGV